MVAPGVSSRLRRRGGRRGPVLRRFRLRAVDRLRGAAAGADGLPAGAGRPHPAALLDRHPGCDGRRARRANGPAHRAARAPAPRPLAAAPAPYRSGRRPVPAAAHRLDPDLRSLLLRGHGSRLGGAERPAAADRIWPSAGRLPARVRLSRLVHPPGQPPAAGVPGRGGAGPAVGQGAVEAPASGLRPRPDRRGRPHAGRVAGLRAQGRLPAPVPLGAAGRSDRRRRPETRSGRPHRFRAGGAGPGRAGRRVLFALSGAGPGDRDLRLAHACLARGAAPAVCLSWTPSFPAPSPCG